MREEDLNRILKIGVQLSSERNLTQLMERILDCAMALTHCDAGTLYLLDKGKLHFKIMRNNTLTTLFGGDGREPLPPVPLERGNVCAMALLEGRTVNIENVKECRDYDFSGPARYDAATGYNTQSMLVVPMHNREGLKIGVLQLINALDKTGAVCPFDPDLVLAVESVASQAAITIQNASYIKEIRELFNSFVRVMSTAIDERTPYNASHTRHMVEYGGRFLDYLNSLAAAEGKEIPFSPEQKAEILMSIWLHDIGKLITPLEVMDKAARLRPDQYASLLHRMEVIRLSARIAHLTGQITEQEQKEVEQQTLKALELIDTVNTAEFVTDDLLSRLKTLQSRSYTDEKENRRPWLEPEEAAMLSIRKGTLSDAERLTMEEHVLITQKLLSQIQFSGEFSHVPAWAGAHHEYLDGSGYPRRLTAEQIPDEVRIITILDIFDALTADDRPYKKAKTPEEASRILTIMAEKEGKLDPKLTHLFLESRCWEKDDAEGNLS